MTIVTHKSSVLAFPQWKKSLTWKPAPSKNMGMFFIIEMGRALSLCCFLGLEIWATTIMPKYLKTTKGL